MEEVPNLINIGPTNPIQILNQHEIFWRFCMCPSNDTLNKNKKISMLELGLHSKDRKSTRDKANISNPNVNRGCRPTHSQLHLSRLCANFTWTLNTIYSTEGLPYLGIQRYAGILGLTQNLEQSTGTCGSNRSLPEKRLASMLAWYQWRRSGHVIQSSAWLIPHIFFSK